MRLARWVRNASLAVVAALTSCVVVDEGPISPDPQYCPQIYAPVCARRGDDRRTFPNECYAEREGYYIIRDGECRRDRPDYPDSRPPRPPRPPQSERPQACPMIYAPVCAQRGNDRRTFENSCQANAAGYGIIREGECRGDGGMRPPGGSVPGGVPGSTPGGVPGSSGPSQPPVTNQPPQQPGPPGACTREFAPVCGTLGGARQTFSNACMAREAGARQIRPGQC